MTDIVQRLRAHEISRHHGGCADCYAVTMDKAADEIERPRAALDTCRKLRKFDAAEIKELRETVKYLQTTLENMEKIA